MMDEVEARVEGCVPPSRCRLWWLRATAGMSLDPARFDGELLVRSTVRFSLLERVLLLFGRAAVVEVTVDPARITRDDRTERMLASARTFAWTSRAGLDT